jgi:hypothetical protein
MQATSAFRRTNYIFKTVLFLVMALVIYASVSYIHTSRTNTNTVTHAENTSSIANPESKINHIKIIKVTKHGVDIEIDYHYHGAGGDAAIVTVELITPDNESDSALRKMVGAVRVGSGKRIARIERPMLDVDEFSTKEIKVTFTKRDSTEVILEKTVAIPVIWESILDSQSRELVDYWGGIAGGALQSKNFAGLDRAIKKWNDPTLRTVDGNWRLEGLIKIFKLIGMQDRWESVYSNIQEWKEHSPGKPGPAIIESLYWHDYAWHARGGGFSSKVTEIGRKLFKERLATAEKVLLDSKEYASGNPLWHYQYINVALGLGWDKSRILSLFAEAANKSPGFYQTYFATARSMSPVWGGSYELMDKVAKSSVELTRENEGDMVYTRVYQKIDKLITQQADFFKDTMVDWVLMREGFEQLIIAYPYSTWHLSSYASFACRAGDKETYLRLRKKIKVAGVNRRAWTSAYSPDTCDHMYMQRL